MTYLDLQDWNTPRSVAKSFMLLFSAMCFSSASFSFSELPVEIWEDSHEYVYIKNVALTENFNKLKKKVNSHVPMNNQELLCPVHCYELYCTSYCTVVEKCFRTGLKLYWVLMAELLNIKYLRQGRYMPAGVYLSVTNIIFRKCWWWAKEHINLLVIF